MRTLIVSFLMCVLCLGLLNPVIAKAPETKNLDSVIAAIEKTVAEKKIPVVVFDLDGTLFDTAQRNVRILQEWAKENSSNPDAKAISQVTAKDAGYSIVDTLKNISVTTAETVSSVRNFWFKRFFTNEYVVIDEPIPGGPAFVNACHDKGALIVYLTGRDTPQMGKGTEESLQKHGLPMDGKTAILMLKSSPEIKDFKFKQDSCNRIRELGSVVAVFENQPRNLNALLREFPEAIPVFIDSNYDLKDTESPPASAIRLKHY